MNRKILILGLVAFAMLATGIGCKTSSDVTDFPNINLNYWGVFENSGDIHKLTDPYSVRHPKINIKYTKLREDEYKQKMLEAWALGEGPDLFMIPVTKLREFSKFLMPMPSKMTAPVQYETGTIKKEIINELKSYSGYTTKNIRDLYIDTVANDVIIDGKIYGLPYSIDTLSVYYNREILKNNNIPIAATTWQDLIAQAPNISKIDSEGNLVQSAIALGTTNNIPNILDIISTLLMQVGIDVDDSRGVHFISDPESLNTIQFYLSFAKEGLLNYSWNENMGNALDSFTSGKLAYFIGYPHHAEMITKANPKLDWDIIPLFKPSNVQAAPTYANYWVTVVTNPHSGNSASAQQAEIAWQFLIEASNKNNVRSFLYDSSRPRVTALKSLVSEQQQNPVLGPFAENLLLAKNWYHGYNYELAEKYFLEMLTNISSADPTVNPGIFITAAESLITQTYKPNR